MTYTYRYNNKRVQCRECTTLLEVTERDNTIHVEPCPTCIGLNGIKRDYEGYLRGKESVTQAKIHNAQ